MPRWKALPEELDPQIREFASQLRRLVDRSGLNINAVADRTGYSKTSWERYLNGRLLAPRGAVVALAEVTGTPQHHLTTMWELAERAWSRAEMRHDMTMEAIRITQARAALGELGTTGPNAPAAGGRTGRSAGGRHSAAGSGARVPAGADPTPRDAGSSPAGRGTPGYEAYGPGPDGRPADAYGSHGPGSDAYGPDAHAPHGPDAHAPHGPDAHAPHGPDVRGPGVRDAGRPPSVPLQRGSAPEAQGQPQSPYGQQYGHQYGQQQAHEPGRPQGGSAGGKAAGGGPRKAVMLSVGAVGALIVAVGAVLLAPGGEDPATATPPPSAAPTTAAPELPVGVECSGADCAGQDPEAMGCGGEYARTVASAVVGGSKVEVRYSKICSASWARLTEAAVGDTVRITAGAGGQDGEVMGDTDAYTPMVAVKKADDAKACATLSAGTKGCTTTEG